MANLGQLFVELGVIGDTKELDKASKQLKEFIKQNDEYIKSLQDEEIYQSKLAEATEKITKAQEELNKAVTDSERQAAQQALDTAKKRKELLSELKAKRDENKAAKEKLIANEKLKVSQSALTKEISGTTGAMAGIVTGVAAAVFAMDKLAQSLISQNQAWVNITRQTDLALGKFQEYAGVAGLLDKSLGAEGAAGSIQQLNDRLFELKLTGQGARGFQLAGINPMGTDAFGVLDQLRTRVAGLNNTSATYLLRQMGLDPRLLPMLRMTREEFEQLAEVQRKYTLNAEQRASIQQMNTQLSIAKQQLQYIKDRALLKLMPVLVTAFQSISRIAEALARMANWISKNVKHWQIFLGTVIAAKFGVFTKLISFLKGISTYCSGLIAKIPIIGRLLGAVAGFAAKALLPLVTAFLILDDIATYLRGGDSVLGVIIDWFKELGEDFGNIFKKMFNGDIFGGVQDLLIKLIDILDDFVQAVLLVCGKITGLPLANWGKKFANFLSGDNYDNLKKYEYGDASSNLNSPNSLALATPGVRSSISNSTSHSTTNNTDNRQVNQTISIYTEQPADDIQTNLRYANAVFA